MVAQCVMYVFTWLRRGRCGGSGVVREPPRGERGSIHETHTGKRADKHMIYATWDLKKNIVVTRVNGKHLGVNLDIFKFASWEKNRSALKILSSQLFTL